MLEFDLGGKEPMYVSEKFNSSNILQDISNIENMEKRRQNLTSYFIKNSASNYDYKI